MGNRRHFLQRSLALPLIAIRAKPRVIAKSQSPHCEILSDPCCCLSQESAAAYRFSNSLANGLGSVGYRKDQSAREIIIAAGLRSVSSAELTELRSRASEGAWLLWERAASFANQPIEEYDERFAEVFGVGASAAQNQTAALYVRYNWPEATLVRRMGALPRFSHPTARIIATWEGEACGFRQAVGNGGFVYLGSMLGPQMAAADGSAKTLLTQLLRSNFKE